MSISCTASWNRPHFSTYLVNFFAAFFLNTIACCQISPFLSYFRCNSSRILLSDENKNRQSFPYQLTERIPVMQYFDSANTASSYKFADELRLLLQRHCSPKHTLIFLCIGSDRATGDCLGPILGYKLSRFRLPNCIVYGTLEKPVHAKNLGDVITEIHSHIKYPFIIAIDASLGKMNHIGYYTLSSGPLKPGAGVNKSLPEVGDVTITGIVNLSGFLDHMLLQTTRLNVVMQLADRICDGILHCFQKIRYSSDHFVFEPAAETSALRNASCTCLSASPIVLAAPESNRASI